MNPSVKDRLGSVVRALGGVVLPALPKEASLAQEQVMLAIGHIQIILAQMDAAPAFEEEEARDLERMGKDIAQSARGGPKTVVALAALEKALDESKGKAADARTLSAQDAIDAVLLALAEDGDGAARSAVTNLVLEQGAARAEKDRRWFAAMGFDIDYSGGG
jgi:hypothetical protein